MSGLHTRNSDGLCKFGISKEVGEYGENVLREFLSYYYNIPVSKVVDARNDLTCRELDIDFVVHTKHQGIKTYEVKTDTYYKSENMAFEYISCVEANTPGCLVKTQADFVLYYFPKKKKAWRFKTEALKSYVLPRIQSGAYKKREVYNKGYYGTKTTIIYLVPLKELENNLGHYCTVFSIEDFN